MAKHKVEVIKGTEEFDNEELLKALISKIKSQAAEPINVRGYTQRLMDVLNNYNETTSFEVGQLVVWKEGLKNKKMPDYGVPAVVVKVYETPVIDEQAPLASPYYGEELNLKLAFLDEDNELLTFHYDGNRFKIFEQEDE